MGPCKADSVYKAPGHRGMQRTPKPLMFIQDVGSRSPKTKVRCRYQAPASSRWWRIVWCQACCHKRDHAAELRALTDAATEAGASLVSLKKACNFAVWASHVQRPPFVLLTDWREVKPCLRAAAKQPPQNRPLFTLVVAELEQFERVSTWARSLPPSSGLVHCCMNLSQAHVYINKVMAKAYGSGDPADASAHSRGGAGSWSWPAEIQRMLLPTAPGDVVIAKAYGSGDPADASAHSWGGAGSWSWPPPTSAMPASWHTMAHECSVPVPWKPELLSTPAPSVARRPALNLSGMEVVSWLMQTHEGALLEELLQRGVPDFYED